MENQNEEQGFTEEYFRMRNEKVLKVSNSILNCLDGLSVDESNDILRHVRELIPQNSVIKVKRK
jgi:hypothetical protein